MHRQSRQPGVLLGAICGHHNRETFYFILELPIHYTEDRYTVFFNLLLCLLLFMCVFLPSFPTCG